jgi:hypothetical protein
VNLNLSLTRAMDRTSGTFRPNHAAASRAARTETQAGVTCRTSPCAAKLLRKIERQIPRRPPAPWVKRRAARRKRA